MRKHGAIFVRGFLIIALMVGTFSSATGSDVAHDPMQLVQILAEHHAEIERHGHAHEDVADLMHLFHDHAHQSPDHDHNVLFFPPHAEPKAIVLVTIKQPLAHYAMLSRREYGLDRPPRV